MTNVYFYVANIIDYFRFFSLFGALYLHDKNPICFFITYFISFSLDLFDGMAARHFQQFSRFGSALDMICDRLTTASLLVILSKFYPDYFIVFLGLLLLDVGSHWLQVYSSLLVINENKDIKNHKEIKEIFWLMDIYYHNKYFLFTVCLFAEIFLLLAYTNFFYFDLMEIVLYKALFYISLSIYALKQFISVLQILGAADRVVQLDNKNRIKGN